jgi:hypothetical protein
MHRDLLPEEIAGFDAEGFGARIEPYQAYLHRGDWLELEVEVRNPSPSAVQAEVRLVLPAGWGAEPAACQLELAPLEGARPHFRVTPPPNLTVRRARLAVDLTIDGRRFGQQAEALVNIDG